MGLDSSGTRLQDRKWAGQVSRSRDYFSPSSLQLWAPPPLLTGETVRWHTPVPAPGRPGRFGTTRSDLLPRGPGTCPSDDTPICSWSVRLSPYPERHVPGDVRRVCTPDRVPCTSGVGGGRSSDGPLLPSSGPKTKRTVPHGPRKFGRDPEWKG